MQNVTRKPHSYLFCVGYLLKLTKATWKMKRWDEWADLVLLARKFLCWYYWDQRIYGRNGP